MRNRATGELMELVEAAEKFVTDRPETDQSHCPVTLAEQESHKLVSKLVNKQDS